MKIRAVTDYLNHCLLPVYQENYDNAGFLIGDPDTEILGVLVTLDVTPAVIDEAVNLGCNLIVSHHPLIFNGLKRITPSNQTSRMVMRLIQEGIAVYAAHTNADNLLHGVNGMLANQLGLTDRHILRPLEGVLRKLVTYVPRTHAETLRQALFAAGGGCIGAYDECSYNSNGMGTFRAHEGCNPFCGVIGEQHQEEETRIEVIYEKRLERRLLDTLCKAHPYEEPAYDCLPLANPYPAVGAGIIGLLPNPIPTDVFLEVVKQKLHIPVLRCSALCREKISRIALCGGSGSFLIPDAKAAGADIFLTADLKYHDFQSAEGEIILADGGHFETEQFVKVLFSNLILEKFSTFACHISENDKGYISYI